MSGRCERELEYLHKLAQKYNSAHYIRKYFGFSFKEIADKLGISKGYFSNMVRGQIPMPEKYQEHFKVLFKDMKIEERTQNFQESDFQKSTRELMQRLKYSLTKAILLFIILPTMVPTIFFKNFLPQLPLITRRRLISNSINFIDCLNGAVAKNVTALFIFLSIIAQKIHKIFNPVSVNTEWGFLF